jgi:hypothetical protein
MSIERDSALTRRTLIRGALGAAFGAAAATIATARNAFAGGDDGRPIVIGDSYPDVRTGTSLRSASLGNSASLMSLSVAARMDSYPTVLEMDAGFGTAINANSHTLKAMNVSVLGRNAAVEAGSKWEAGVIGSGGPLGVRGTGATGVFGVGSTTGVRGSGQTAFVGHGRRRGAVLRGRKAAVRLQPTEKRGHPRSGLRGDLLVDRNGKLWFCRGGSDWVRIA